ncbi:hypothetical protein PQY73_01495 [Schleiferiaceae bacterium]|nr:hypothetical protein [Schleiferiaceae bacterium]
MISNIVKQKLEHNESSYIENLRKHLLGLNPLKVSVRGWNSYEDLEQFVFSSWDYVRKGVILNGGREQRDDVLIPNNPSVAVLIPKGTVDRFKFFIEIKLEVSRIHSYYIEKEIRGFFSSKTERINKEQKVNDIRRFVCCPLLTKEEEYHEFFKHDDKVELDQLVEFIKENPHRNPVDESILNDIQNVFKEFIAQLEEDVALEKEKANTFLSTLEVDTSGLVIPAAGEDLLSLLKKHQNDVQSFNVEFVSKFVKISNYLKQSKETILLMHKEIEGINDDYLKTRCLTLLSDQVSNYNVLTFNSFIMLTAIVEEDLITFYEVNEFFDSLNVFDTHWQKEVLDELKHGNSKLEKLLISVISLESAVAQGFNRLSFVVSDSIEQLTNSVSRELKGVKSSIEFGNLLNTIQVYQMYKINKNTKGLR